MKTERAGGFTVIELLSVIIIVGLLGVFFFPVLASSKAEARTVLCAENLAQMGRAGSLYAEDNNGKFPGTQHDPPSWVEGFEKYCSPERFTCAELMGDQDAKWTYALNDFLTAHPYGARRLNFSKVTSVPKPAETMMFGEAAREYRRYDHFHFADEMDNGYTPEAFGEQVDVERHETMANYLFVDGRVERLGWSSGAKPKLKSVASRFVHPMGGSMSSSQMVKR